MNQTTMFDITAPAQYDDMPLAQPERTEARGNRGTFDPNSDKITESKGER